MGNVSQRGVAATKKCLEPGFSQDLQDYQDFSSPILLILKILIKSWFKTNEHRELFQRF